MFAAQFVVTARIVVGIVFAVAAIGKLRSPRRFTEFADSLAPLGRPGTDWRPVAAAVAAGEVATATLLALPSTAGAGLAMATALLAALAAGIVTSLTRGRELRCRCFGTGGATLRATHVVRNAALAGLSGSALLVHLAGPPADIPFDLAAPAALLGAFLALVVLRWDDLTDLLSPVHRA
jgi:hypothetical protein